MPVQFGVLLCFLYVWILEAVITTNIHKIYIYIHTDKITQEAESVLYHQKTFTNEMKLGYAVTVAMLSKSKYGSTSVI